MLHCRMTNVAPELANNTSAAKMKRKGPLFLVSRFTVIASYNTCATTLVPCAFKKL